MRNELLLHFDKLLVHITVSAYVDWIQDEGLDGQEDLEDEVFFE